MKNIQISCEQENPFDLDKPVYECPACGNHVCKTCATLWNNVCPHCFGRLYRIS